MGKYIFDIETGHYVLNEAETTAQNNTQALDLANSALNTNSTETTLPTNNSVLPNLDSNDVIAAKNKMQAELKIIDTTAQKNENNRLLIEALITDLTNKYNAAQGDAKDLIRTNIVATNAKMLQLMSLISTNKKKRAILEDKYTQLILQLQSKLNESYIRVLPTKYAELNEEILELSKIYMRNLVQNDDMHIIKEMSDFKNVFGKTNLLYGRDKKGYFVICTDLDDLNDMFNTLCESGYNRDFVMDNIMPLLYN